MALLAIGAAQRFNPWLVTSVVFVLALIIFAWDRKRNA
jgi:hypothetical protein